MCTNRESHEHIFSGITMTEMIIFFFNSLLSFECGRSIRILFRVNINARWRFNGINFSNLFPAPLSFLPPAIPQSISFGFLLTLEPCGRAFSTPLYFFLTYYPSTTILSSIPYTYYLVIFQPSTFHLDEVLSQSVCLDL